MKDENQYRCRVDEDLSREARAIPVGKLRLALSE
jgi:hypothetical protein